MKNSKTQSGLEIMAGAAMEAMVLATGPERKRQAEIALQSFHVLSPDFNQAADAVAQKIVKALPRLGDEKSYEKLVLVSALANLDLKNNALKDRAFVAVFDQYKTGSNVDFVSIEIIRALGKVQARSEKLVKKVCHRLLSDIKKDRFSYEITSALTSIGKQTSARGDFISDAFYKALPDEQDAFSRRNMLAALFELRNGSTHRENFILIAANEQAQNDPDFENRQRAGRILRAMTPPPLSAR